ncbi:MAG: hypothetical protein Q7R95_00135 [bacterium]|nr:hypothetical protein [bacterium]
MDSGEKYEESAWGFYDKIGYNRLGIIPKMFDERDAMVWMRFLNISLTVKL